MSEQDRVRAEEGRVTAEHGRVEAEAGRAHAESNEGSGRVESEIRREGTHAAYKNELDKLVNDPEHYVTPGARNYFRRVIWGYIILAIAGAIGTYSVTTHVDHRIRRDINNVAKAQCFASVKTIMRYNDLVENQIEFNREARDLNLNRGDIKTAKIRNKAIVKLQDDKLRVPSKADCERPLLK